MSFSHVEIPIRQPSDLSNQNSIIPIKALVNRKWTLEQKFVLCILVRWYMDSWNDKAMIFNAYFQGAADRPFPENVLRSMWHELAYKRHGNGIMEIIWQDTAWSLSSSAWAAARAALEDIASERGLTLQKRTREESEITGSKAHKATPSSPGNTKRKRCVLPVRCSSPENEASLMFPQVRRSCLNNIFETPIKSRIRLSEAEGDDDLTHESVRRRMFVNDPISTYTDLNGTRIVTPPCSSQKDKSLKGCNGASNSPRLAYRAANSSSQGLNSPMGLRAGRYKKSDIIPPSPSPQSPAYRNDARSHISSVPTGSTSFISVTRNLLRAFHHGFKTASDSSIYVIDLHEVERLHSEHRCLFGSVQSVKSLQLESPNGYSGSGEYVIWGEVKRDAIVSCQAITQILSNMLNGGRGDPFYMDVISSSKYSTSARNQIKNTHTPLTPNTGKAVGNFIRALRIPRKYLDEAVYSIITDWCFDAARDGTWHKNQVFMRGVREGFRGDTVETFQLEKPISSHSGDTTVDEVSSNNSQEGEEAASIGDAIHEDTEDESKEGWANNPPDEGNPKEHTPEDGVSDDTIPNLLNANHEVDLLKLKEDSREHAFLEEMEEVLGIENPTAVVPHANLTTHATYAAQLLTAIKSEPGLDS